MRSVCGFFLILYVLAIGGCDAVYTEKVYHRGAVVCSDAIAAEAGLRTLENGGNAIDAACATAFTLAATYPQAGNLGGGGFALVYMADSQKVYYLDFRETAPQAITPQFYLDASGEVDRTKALTGPSAAGTPGSVAGLAEMHRRFGSADWAELVRPARSLADTGFIVNEYLARALADDAGDLNAFPASAEIFLPEGQPLRAGQRCIQPDLAGTLSLIETQGAAGFYDGEVAAAIADYCAAAGGLISLDDLRDYHAVWREPVRFRFRSLDIYAAGLPSSGGVVMGQILTMLNHFELERYTAASPEFIHLFAETARRAYADRSAYLGDPDFTPDLTERLLDSAYIASRLNTIDGTVAGSSDEIRPGLPGIGRESDNTTHLVTVDSAGNIVSLTTTVNSWFGSKAVVPGGGFFLNNEMDDFAIAPDVPNAFGLTGGEANKVEGGKRMLSSMTPTIILKGGNPYLALGSPGGSKIITAIAQTIVKYHVYDMTLSEAIVSPRVHHQWRPDTLYVEAGGFDAGALDRLCERGHTVVARTPFAEVTAVSFSPDGLSLTAVADPRRGGATATGY